jgi:hypothetical protein
VHYSVKVSTARVASYLGEKDENTLKKALAVVMIVSIALFTFLSAAIPAAKAAWINRTVDFLFAEPDLVGINQGIQFTAKISPAPGGENSYTELYFLVTYPDGTTQSAGPFTSYSDGFAYWSYEFWEVGTYSIYIYSPHIDVIGVNSYSNFSSTRTYFTVQVDPVIYHDLTIGHTGSGTMYPYEGTEGQIEGDLVTVTAVPDAGWALNYWLLDGYNVGSGVYLGPYWTYDVTMDTAHQIVAVFYQPQYTLTVNIVGTGSVTRNPNQATYASGTVVTLTASAGGGWSFSSWSGDAIGSANPTTITMNANKVVTATFSLTAYTLTVNIVGSGSVTKTPNAATYLSGTVVTLNATPASGWSFSGWSGALTGSTNPTTITMNSAQTVTATFTQPTQYALTVNIVGSGSVTKSPNQATYAPGTVVTLTATAASGWSFTGYSGGVTGTNPTATITMNSAQTVTATFTQPNPVQYTLTVNVVGSGTTDPAPDTYTFSEAETVVVDSNPDNGWVLDHWLLGGNNVGSIGSCTVTMDQNYVLTAVFAVASPVQNEYELIISVVGSGTTDPAPGTYATDADNSVTVAASADNGWKLDYWMLDGVDIGSETSCTFTMDQDYVLTAVYIEEGTQATGEFNLTIDVVGSGITDPTPGIYVADAHASAAVAADPEVGWELDYWSLDGVDVGSNDSYTVTMDQNHILTAVFRESGSSGEDTVPPVIGEPSINPGEPTNDKDVAIEFSVTDATSNVSSATLVYRVSEGEWIEVPAVFSGQVWSATIPKQENGTYVDFYVGSYDTQGNYAETDIYRYYVTMGGTPLWMVAAAVGGIAASTVGVAAFLVKSGGRAALSLRRKTIRLKNGDKSKEGKQRKEEEKPKLEWSLVSPSTIRSGGFAIAQGEIRNVGQVIARGVAITTKGPPELKVNPPLEIGDIEKNGRKGFRIKLECAEVSEGKKSLMYTLTVSGKASQTIVRAFDFYTLKVGFMDDSHHIAYIKKAGLKPSDPKQLSAWLTDNHFDFTKISEAEDYEALLDFDVILASSQLALSDRDVANLKRYVESGRGLVSMNGVGTINADAYLKGEANYAGETRVYNLFGYGRPEVGTIERGLKKIRIVQNVHPVAETYEKSEMISLLSQTGIAFKSSVSTAKMIADQRVSLGGTTGFLEVPAVVAGVFGKGRVVHFNFNAGAEVGAISTLVDQALVWAAGQE